MFDFRKKRLDPLIRLFSGRITAALPLNRPEQAVSLLSLKKDISASLGGLSRSQGFRGKSIFFTALATTIGLAVAAVAIPEMAAFAAGGAAIAFLGGMFASQKYALNKGAAAHGRYVLNERIDAEVMQAMTGFGVAMQTPEFKSMLTESFGAASKKEYEALARRAMKTAPPAPKPAAQPAAPSA